MKKLMVIALSLFALQLSRAQTTEVESELRSPDADTLRGWVTGGVFNIATTQTSLTNWTAGGQSSVSVSGLFSVYVNLHKDKSLWENSLDLGYGNVWQGKATGWRKTDDKIDLTSKLGIRASNKLYYAALLNFKTQMAPGYHYPNDSTVISRFLAPGYLMGALGIDYKPDESFAAFVAPLTLKMTIVNDKVLSDEGSFGVEPGNSVYNELGAYVRLSGKMEIMENIAFQTKLDLFSNYLHNPQNIDVGWETLLSMKVNKYISATLSTNLVYDDDIKIPVDKNDDGVIEENEKGPRVQFKEVLAVGFSMIF